MESIGILWIVLTAACAFMLASKFWRHLLWITLVLLVSPVSIVWMSRKGIIPPHSYLAFLTVVSLVISGAGIFLGLIIRFIYGRCFFKETK